MGKRKQREAMRKKNPCWWLVVSCDLWMSVETSLISSLQWSRSGLRSHPDSFLFSPSVLPVLPFPSFTSSLHSSLFAFQNFKSLLYKPHCKVLACSKMNKSVLYWWRPCRLFGEKRITALSDQWSDGGSLGPDGTLTQPENGQGYF